MILKQWKKILSYVHTETPILSYNHETELSAIESAYLSARDIALKEKIKLEKVCSLFFIHMTGADG